METPTYQLTAEGIAALELMAQKGAENASASLSALINQKVDMKTLAVRALPIEKISDIVGSPEDKVATVIMEVRGEVNGNIMLIYPEQSSINVADLLAKRALGTTTQLSELDKSALKESGNIISGAFLSSISNYLTINMVESIPDIAIDMLRSTIDFVLARFAKHEISEAVAFEIDFEMSTDSAATDAVKAYFILLLDVVSATDVLESLKKISGGQAMKQ
jgi:chemotaxis protein CheC